MAKKYILGNWKMHGTLGEAQALAREMVACERPNGAEVVLFPPFTALSSVHAILRGTPVALGGQDCSTETQGAFTGDISAFMLKDAGCAYVILGHSERRSLHAESDAQIQRKAQAALNAGLIPVLCVGESRQERESGAYLDIIRAQVMNSLPATTINAPFLIAYEPVWAIGSGATPTPQEISEVHKSIASAFTYATSGAQAGVVYGGSVKAANARAIIAADGVDGLLVGGASLKASEFSAIIASAQDSQES